jgi:hypothetical protein
MITKEKLQHHADHLKTKHQLLDDEIDRMEQTGAFEDNKIRQLKLNRLHLKEEIDRTKDRIKKLNH